MSSRIPRPGAAGSSIPFWITTPPQAGQRPDRRTSSSAFIRKHELKVEWILETHVHADHLSAAPYVKQRLGRALGIGENVRVVQDIFGKVFNAGTEFQRDGSQFDHLFIDGERFTIGELDAVALHTPGQTPDCMTYVIGDSAFLPKDPLEATLAGVGWARP